MDEAQKCGWIVAMDDGKVLATGNTAELNAENRNR